MRLVFIVGDVVEEMNRGLDRSFAQYVHRVNLGYTTPKPKPIRLHQSGCFLVKSTTMHKIDPATKRLFSRYPCLNQLRVCPANDAPNPVPTGGPRHWMKNIQGVLAGWNEQVIPALVLAKKGTDHKSARLTLHNEWVFERSINGIFRCFRTNVWDKCVHCPLFPSVATHCAVACASPY